MDNLTLELDELTVTTPPRPILKWVGGKTQILSQVLERFPKTIKDYHEPFVGGGSVLLGLLHSVEKGDIKMTGKIYAYDLNEALVNMYKNIQTRHSDLYTEIQRFCKEYNDCETDTTRTLNRKPSTIDEAKLNKENYYYWSRTRYNQIQDKDSIECSALFVFLNKTCFRGVYRVGPNGFNVPYGNYVNPRVIDRDHLERVSKLLRNVTFKCQDFKETLTKTKFSKRDFVYLDPPYVPENLTSFVKYNKSGFDLSAHESLFKAIRVLPCKFVMSNSNTPLVLEEFSQERFRIDEIIAKRSINSTNPGKKITEVFVST